MAKLKRDKEVDPKIQKAVLLFFGLGPILAMGWFLTSQGFFNSP